MSHTHPTNHSYNDNDEGQWLGYDDIQPYPSQYDHDDEENPYRTDQTLQFVPQFDTNSINDYYRPSTTYMLPLAIRRHPAGSTDPEMQELPVRNLSATSHAPVTVQRNPPPPSPVKRIPPPPSPVKQIPRLRSPVRRIPPPPSPVQMHSPDSDERPIQPMKNTAVYTLPPSQKKITQPKTSLSQPKRVQSPPQYESEPIQLRPSRPRVNNVIPRRPIRVDLIPKTPFGIRSQRSRPHQIVVEEYAADDDDDDDYVVEHVNPPPKKILAYQPVTRMTTREMENYQMAKTRLFVHGQTSPIKTIIYRT